MKRPCVYIVTNKPGGTLYIGVTSDIAKRSWEHRAEVADGFTRRYSLHTLVHVEFFETMPEAILREKQMKKWHRQWKLNLIIENNPDWRDLFDTTQA
jgi:putative endonuclease